jgi:hypothetical protein
LPPQTTSNGRAGGGERSDCETGVAGATFSPYASAATGSPRSEHLNDDRSTARRSLTRRCPTAIDVTASAPLRVRRAA